MACAGLSTRRLAFTLLLTGLMATSLALILGELVVPPLERRADTLYAHLRISSLTGESQAAPWLRLGPWYLGHSPDGQLLGLKVDGGHRLVQRLAGPSLKKQAPARVAEAQALWSRSLGCPEAQSSMALWRRLRSLRGAGHTRPVETLVLHTKLAYPVVNLVATLLVCILTLPFSARRRGSQVRDLGQALGLILGLWFLIASGWLFGRSGWLHPAPAVWGPVALAAAAGIVGWKVKGLGS